MYKKIYDAMFTLESYNSTNVSSELRFSTVLNYLKSNIVNSIVDIGSGRGILLEEIIKLYPQIQITSIDLTKYHNLDIEFIELDITTDDKKIINKKYDLLICTDCLEHIEKNKLDEIINWFSNISKNAIITTANHDEFFYINGIKTDLHITKEKSEFWDNIIKRYFNIIDFINEKDIWYFYTLESKTGVNNV